MSELAAAGGTLSQFALVVGNLDWDIINCFFFHILCSAGLFCVSLAAGKMEIYFIL